MGETAQHSPTGIPWQPLSPEQTIPMMSVSIPAFLLGLHFINGVVANFQPPSFIQTLSKDKPDGQGDRLFTFPPGVINVDDLKRFTPRKRHLKPQKLMKRLRNDFDTFWMSVDLPDDLLETHIIQKLDTSMEEHLSEINLTALEFTLQATFSREKAGGDVGSGVSNITSGILDIVKSWLVETSSCPVYYRWEDLGLLYWPRWVRRGMCSLKDTPLFKLSPEAASKIPKFSSCSWPPGMHCVPGKAKKLKILRWQCRHNKALNNFNRFRLPGMAAHRSLPTRQHADVDKPQSPTNKQHLESHGPEGSNITRQHFEHLKQQLNAKSSKDRYKRDASRTSSELERGDYRSSTESSQKEGRHINQRTHSVHHEKWKGMSDSPDSTKQAEDVGKLRGDAKGKHLSDNDGNDTENWNRMSWKQRQKSLDLKCKWIKIPYPVTDDCFCSC